MSKIFEHISFLVVNARKEQLDKWNKLRELLVSNGCYRCEVVSSYDYSFPNGEDRLSKFIDLVSNQKVHFIISDTVNFSFYRTATYDLLIPVVTEDWVYKCIEVNKLVKTNSFSPDQNLILKNCQIFLSPISLTKTESLFYSELINALGGTTVDHISNVTTHIVTDDPSDQAVIATIAWEKKQNMHFVYPTWLCHCLKEMKYVNERVHMINIESSIEDARSTMQDVWNQLEDIENTRTLTILSGHKFYLGMDLLFEKNIYNYLISLIECCGGKVIRHIDENDFYSKKADCYMGFSIKSREYRIAESLKLTTVNIPWLFYVWEMDEFIDPNSKIYLKPFKKKLFEKSQLILAYTNYFGPQRYYIQRLTKIVGGIASTELSKKNTHLLFGFPHGKKYEFALKRVNSLTTTNHRWLEDCYIAGQKLDPHCKKYTSNDFNELLSTALGQCSINSTDVIKLAKSLATGQMGTETHGQQRLNVDSNFSNRNTISEQENVINELNRNSKVEDSTSDILQSKETKTFDDTINTYVVSLGANERKLIKEIGNFDSIPENFNYHSQDNSQSATQVSTQAESPIKGGNDYDESIIQPLTLKENDSFSTILTPSSKSESDQTAKDKQIKHHLELTDNMNQSTESAFVGDIFNKIQKKTNIETEDHQKTLTDEGEVSVEPIKHHQNDNNDQGEDVNYRSLSGSRAAKAKAAKRLHTDIESLNQFQKNSKKKRIGDLLPEELSLIKQQKELEKEAKNILLELLPSIEANIVSSITSSNHLRSKLMYNIDAVCTGCLDGISALDKQLLFFLGIRIYDEIDNDNIHQLNTVIAPKQMRTAKFLKSLSFHPLKYMLIPEFVLDILETIHKRSKNSSLQLRISDYFIPDVSPDILQKTHMQKKLFERYGIQNVNIMNDVQGGIDTISSIFYAHGIKEVKTVKGNFTINDFILNKQKGTSKTKNSNKNKHLDCIFLNTKPAQEKRFKKILNENNLDGLSVNWDWCARSILDLDIDINDKKIKLISKP